MSEELRISLVTTQAELNECLLVRRAVFIREQGVTEEEEIDEHDGDPATVTSALHVLGRVEGFPSATGRLLLDYPAGENAHIGRVAVMQQLRGRGYGRAVMEALQAQARERDIAGITLDAQLHAISFYEGLGYVARGDVFLDAGIKHRSMDLAL
ncbi:MAG: GNAT family N-acetyltransferase [Dehalococcoidia bacterium]|nr:GNAT family N-acetyltransferase [Dehalococcoidia bacterium]